MKEVGEDLAFLRIEVRRDGAKFANLIPVAMDEVNVDSVQELGDGVDQWLKDFMPSIADGWPLNGVQVTGISMDRRVFDEATRSE